MRHLLPQWNEKADNFYLLRTGASHKSDYSLLTKQAAYDAANIQPQPLRPRPHAHLKTGFFFPLYSKTPIHTGSVLNKSPDYNAKNTTKKLSAAYQNQ